MTTSEITLTRTYFLSRKEDLPKCYRRYLERVERVKQFTTLYLVADTEHVESNALVRENLLHDLRAQSDDSLNEDEWGLYSYCTALGSIEESIEPGAAVSRLWGVFLYRLSTSWVRLWGCEGTSASLR